MPFSERVKLLAKAKAAFRCCVCHKPFVEVHHLIPEAKGGPSTIANAAPLCASCHDLYGGNPDKRKTLTQMRDHWWHLMEGRNKRLHGLSESVLPYEIHEDPNFSGSLRRSRIMLYHCIFPKERFEESADILLKLVHETQERAPNQRRILYLDIEGHRIKDGWFDNEMAELQLSFLATFLIKFVSEIHSPLLHLQNKRLQNNQVPEGLRHFKKIDAKTIQGAIEEGIEEIFDSDQGVSIRISKGSPAATQNLRARGRKRRSTRKAHQTIRSKK